MGLEFGDWHFGISYDVNTSSLKARPIQEVGLNYRSSTSKKPTDPNAKKLNCPKF
jgi:hypothetical protein